MAGSMTSKSKTLRRLPSISCVIKIKLIHKISWHALLLPSLKAVVTNPKCPQGSGSDINEWSTPCRCDREWWGLWKTGKGIPQLGATVLLHPCVAIWKLQVHFSRSPDVSKRARKSRLVCEITWFLSVNNSFEKYLRWCRSNNVLPWASIGLWTPKLQVLI